MLTRQGQQTLIGDTMEVLFAIEQLLHYGKVEEAKAYAHEARFALTQMANGWVQSDAAYSVLAKSLKKLPEELKND
jgi:hypothetical protein